MSFSLVVVDSLLSDYITCMPEIQKSIYYLTGESLNAVKDSPSPRGPSRRRASKSSFSLTSSMNTSPPQLKEFDSKKIICVSKEGLELEETEDEKKEREDEAAQYEDLCKVVKNALGGKVEKVVISNRIIDSPCILATGPVWLVPRTWSAS